MTTEEIVAKFLEQDTKIESLTTEVAALKLSQAAAVGNKLKQNAKEILPKIPEGLVTLKGKKYKWAYPTFRLPGDATLHLAEEAQFDTEIIEKVLKIVGQNVLIEQK